MKETPAGRIHICGEGKVDEMHGDAYVERAGRLVQIPGKQFGALGYVADAYAPFDTGFVSLRETKDGFEVTELLPFEKNERLPALRRIVHCRAGGCVADKAKCVFKKPKGGVDPSALKRLNKAWDKPEIAHEMAAVSDSIAQELASAAGQSKEPGAKAPAKDEYQDDLMIVYRNALLGHKPSRKLLLDPKVMARLEKSEEEKTEGADYVMVNGALSRLRAAGCLR